MQDMLQNKTQVEYKFSTLFQSHLMITLKKVENLQFQAASFLKHILHPQDVFFRNLLFTLLF